MMKTTRSIAPAELYLLAAVGVVDLIEHEGGDVARIFGGAEIDTSRPHNPLTEVVFLLGYSELGAFSRAFRQWTGRAPARYRRHHGRG